jgi:hypothetical protein
VISIANYWVRLRPEGGLFKLFVIIGAINYAGIVNQKSARIAGLVEAHSGQPLDARYLGYFDCFNHQLFFEAHEVLEDLWLPGRAGANGHFHKALIQLAGAFVHLQKNRLRPAGALLKLAQANLAEYPAQHERLNVAAVRQLIGSWLVQLERGGFRVNPLTNQNRPQLALEPV